MKLCKTLFAAVALLALAYTQAPAQPFGPFTGTFGAVTVTNTGLGVFNTTTVASNAVPLYRARGIAVWPSGAAANNGGGATNMVLTFKLCYDPTLANPIWSDTVLTYTLASTATPGTGFTLYTNITDAAIANAAWLRLNTVAWQETNKLTISNIYWSVFP